MHRVSCPSCPIIGHAMRQTAHTHTRTHTYKEILPYLAHALLSVCAARPGNTYVSGTHGRGPDRRAVCEQSTHSTHETLLACTFALLCVGIGMCAYAACRPCTH